MEIYYVYEKETGASAGSGSAQIDNETHGSTLDAPPNEEAKFKDGRWLRALPAWRVRAAVGISGLSSSIETLFSSMPSNQQIVARAAWSGNIISQASPLLIAAASALGLTSQQLDTIFDLAESFDA